MNQKLKELAVKAHTYADSLAAYEPENSQLFELKFAELIVKMCADAADMAYDARCAYPGDYVAEFMGYGEEKGITAWREEVLK